MAGGLASGPNAPKRKIGQEWPQIRNLYKGQIQEFEKFFQNDPLLGLAQAMAISFNPPSQLINPLMSEFSSLTGGPMFNQFGNWQNQLGGLTNRVGRLGSQIGGIGNVIRGIEGGLPNWTPGLSQAYNRNIAPVIASGGALTPAQERDVSQATRATFAAQGNVSGNQAAGAELLNRQGAQQQRLNTALGQAQGIEGLIGGMTGLRSGLLGQQAGILGQEGALLGQQGGMIGQQSGLLGQMLGLQQGLGSNIQGLESGGLNQLLSTSQAGSGVFANLTDPLLGYAQNLFGGNQAAQLSQQQANSNKMAGLLGGSMSGSSSVLGAILPMIIGMSDKRLKEKIKATGEKTPEGIPIKTFQFKHDPKGQRYMGVIAQDVEKKVPGAVQPLNSGFLGVNFRKIHAPYHAIGGYSAQSSSGAEGSDLPPRVVDDWGNRIGGASPSWWTPQGGQGPTGNPPATDPTIEPPPLEGPPDPTPSTTATGRDPQSRTGVSDMGHSGWTGWSGPPTLSGQYGQPFYFGSNPLGFGTGTLPTWWVNYPGVGPVPMAIPTATNASDPIGLLHSGQKIQNR